MTDKKTLSFKLRPLPPFRLDYTVWALRRRPTNIIDSWNGKRYRRVAVLDGGPLMIGAVQTGTSLRPVLHVTLSGRWDGPDRAVKGFAKSFLEKSLGIGKDLRRFYRMARQDRRLRPLAEHYQGLKPVRFPTVFEALVNAFACQQVTLDLGIILLNRLARKYGLSFEAQGTTFHAFPRPEELSAAEPRDIRALGFSTQKGRAIIELARQALSRKPDFDALETMADEQAMPFLGGLRGVGRWTAEYVMLRGLGRLNVFPGDDVGAQKNLQRFLKLRSKPDYGKVRRVTDRWQPYAGFVYFHLLLEKLEGKGQMNMAGIFTIGHSTRPLDEFIDILKSYDIDELVDVRTVPRSRRVPQYNAETLPEKLKAAGIHYFPMKGLGGLRHAMKDSPNTGWRNASFRGFADYMQTDEFRKNLEALVNRANGKRIAVMCAEAVPWRCHRSLIADALFARNIDVEHIMSATSHHPHTLTPFARVRGAGITYPPERTK